MRCNLNRPYIICDTYPVEWNLAVRDFCAVSVCRTYSREVSTAKLEITPGERSVALEWVSSFLTAHQHN